MTTAPAQNYPEHPSAPPPPPPPPPPRKRHWLRWTLISVGAFIALIIGITAAAGGSHKTAQPGALPSNSISTAPASPELPSAPDTSSQPATPAPAEAAYVTPKPADFTVTLKVLSKQCFGSAGCNVTFRPVLTQHIAKGLLDPAITYDLTYTVTGDESGPQINTLSVTGDQYEQPDEGMASTPSSGTVLSAQVTSVTPQ